MSTGPMYPRWSRAPHPGDLSRPTEAAVLWLCDRACEWAYRAWDRTTARKGDLAEFTSAVFFAVVQAGHSYDPEKGASFQSWALEGVKNACREETRRQGIRSRTRYPVVEELELKRLMGHDLTPEELELLQARPGEEPTLSLDDPAHAADGEEPLTLAESIPDEGPGPEAVVLAAANREALYAAIADAPLTARERTVIAGVLDGRTYAQIGSEIVRQDGTTGISEGLVEHTYVRAVAKLRRTLMDRGVTSL